jgi:DNA-binding beta-propeller fold protein YncE
MLGQFVRPKGVAVDREDRVYVVDASTEVVQIFNAEGKLMLFFGGAGNHPGGLNIPATVVIDYDNVDLFADRVAPGYKIEYLVLVTSQFGPNKVNVFGFIEPDEQSND